MKLAKQDGVEREIRGYLEAGETARAAELAFNYCRTQIWTWLKSIVPDDADAADAFSLFCEDLWKGLPKFRWESSLLTWTYRLAHNAAFRHKHSATRDRPVADIAILIAPSERSRTNPWLRSEVKMRFKRLREQLAPQDRMVLTLRVDRGMSWEAVAQILAGDVQLTTEDLRCRASALRQRFQRVKARLHELAAAEGMLRSRS